MSTGNGRINVGVGKDNVRALSAQFEGKSLECLRSVLHDRLSGNVLTGESNLVDIRMFDQRRSGGRTVAWYNVDHSVGYTSLLSESCHSQTGEWRLFSRFHHDWHLLVPRREEFLLRHLYCPLILLREDKHSARCANLLSREI